MTGAVAQLRALVWLRWQMVRSPGLRFSLYLTPVLLVWIVEVVVTSASSLEQPALAAAVELAPAAFLGFGFLAIIAPLTAGGGNETVPSAQLVAFPVRPRTIFLGGLLLAPINLVWVVQLLVLVAETAYVSRHAHSSGAAGAVVMTSFIVCLTVVGQAVAWAVVGLRLTRPGRRVIAVSGVVAIVGIVTLVRFGLADEVLADSPTHAVVDAISAGPGRLWLLTTVGLLLATAIGSYLGGRLCAWALRRPSDALTSSDTVVRRRSARRTALDELVAVDRASVWRAPALRRGALVLALLPGLVALGAAVPWESLVVLPGLVAAGAGLLFGINAFSLDGSGAVWLASLPHDPALGARAKLSVLIETVTATIFIAVFTGSLRSPGVPTPTQLTGIASAALASGTLVIATCMSLAVHRPHRADLRGPRDAIAPPGALTAASARLALPAAGVGMALEFSSQTDLWWLPPLLAAPVLLGSLVWLRRTMTSHGDPAVRSRIVLAVSAG